jgi:hypothetical protein
MENKTHNHMVTNNQKESWRTFIGDKIAGVLFEPTQTTLVFECGWGLSFEHDTHLVSQSPEVVNRAVLKAKANIAEAKTLITDAEEDLRRLLVIKLATPPSCVSFADKPTPKEPGVPVTGSMLENRIRLVLKGFMMMNEIFDLLYVSKLNGKEIKAAGTFVANKKRHEFSMTLDTQGRILEFEQECKDG